MVINNHLYINIKLKKKMVTCEEHKYKNYNKFIWQSQEFNKST